MKKIILALLLASAAFVSNAQEKGFFLTGAGSLGMNSFRYTLDVDHSSTPKVGYGGAIGVQYYFTPNWGVATGVGLSFYNSKATFSTSWNDNSKYYSFEGMYDNDPLVPNEQYILRLGLNNWTETQQAYFLEVPLMLMYQTRWGLKKTIGMYFGIGAKVQIPILNEEFSVENESELSVLGYYPASGMTLGDDYQRTNYGFGKDNHIGYSGDLDLKTGFAASGEIGFLFDISPRLDLTVGAYLDYGFTDIRKGNKTNGGYLIEPENGTKTIQPSDYIGDNLQYNGYVNSYAVDKVNLLSYGAKVGVRVKLGKVKERPSEEEIAAKSAKHSITETHTSSRDTIFIIYVPQQDTNARYYNNGTYGGNGQDGREQPKNEELRILSEPIFFDLNSDKLLPASITILNRKAAIMEKYPSMQLLITGNTCILGSGNLNIDLGQRRASAAKKYMEGKGIGKDRVSTVSQSFSHPLAPNNNEENREKNRRCDFYPTGY